MFALRFAAQWMPGQPELWQLTVSRWPLLFAWCVHRVARRVRGPVGAFLLWRPIVYIGTISYGIYLVHLFVRPVVGYLEHLVGLHVPFPSVGIGRFVVVYAASIGVAALSWKFIERPINSLKRHFPYTRTAVVASDMEEQAPTGPQPDGSTRSPEGSPGGMRVPSGFDHVADGVVGLPSQGRPDLLHRRNN